MIAFIGQILGCLLIAAGIGGVVGWFLRQLSPGPHTQDSIDANTALSLKEEMLESAQFELKVQAAGMKALESKVLEAEELHLSTSQELSERNERLRALQEELAVRTQRLTGLEEEEAAVQRRVREYAATAAAQSEEIQQLQRQYKAAQQTIQSNEQERRIFSAASPRWKLPVWKTIGSTHAWKNSNRPKDGSIGWKSNSVTEMLSIEPHSINSTANSLNETHASAN